MKAVAWVVGVVAITGCVQATPSETSGRNYYESNVQPILLAKCAHSGCHDNGGGNALDVTSYDSLASHFDLLEPVKPYPPLLAKAAAVRPHGGGAVLDVGSEAFLLLQAWINNGATDE